MGIVFYPFLEHGVRKGQTGKERERIARTKITKKHVVQYLAECFILFVLADSFSSDERLPAQERVAVSVKCQD